jgi:hypothetical protein
MEPDYEPQPDRRRVIITTGTEEEDLVRLCFTKQARKQPTSVSIIGSDEYNNMIASVAFLVCGVNSMDLILMGSRITRYNLCTINSNPNIYVTIIDWNEDGSDEKYRGLKYTYAKVSEVINCMPNWVNILAYPESNDPVTACWLRRGIDNYAIIHGLKLWQVYDLMLDSKLDDPLVDQILQAGKNLHKKTETEAYDMTSTRGVYFKTESNVMVHLVEVVDKLPDYLRQCYMEAALKGKGPMQNAEIGVLVSYSPKKTILTFGTREERKSLLVNMVAVEKAPFYGTVTDNRGKCTFPGRWPAEFLAELIRRMG